jgi:hypothetical protein
MLVEVTWEVDSVCTVGAAGTGDAACTVDVVWVDESMLMVSLNSSAG